MRNTQLLIEILLGEALIIRNNAGLPEVKGRVDGAWCLRLSLTFFFVWACRLTGSGDGRSGRTHYIVCGLLRGHWSSAVHDLVRTCSHRRARDRGMVLVICLGRARRLGRSSQPLGLLILDKVRRLVLRLARLIDAGTMHVSAFSLRKLPLLGSDVC